VNPDLHLFTGSNPKHWFINATLHGRVKKYMYEEQGKAFKLIFRLFTDFGIFHQTS